MGYRLSKIYTRKGDDGTTSVDAKNRIPKNCARIETLGTIDELNSLIGLALAFDIATQEIRVAFEQIQQDLFNLGGELCPPHYKTITADKITHMEKLIDAWNESLPPLTEFIMPGGNPKSATCHLARTVCRRAERCLVTLVDEEPCDKDILSYVNRLSDVLFVAARILAKETGNAEILWEHERK